MTKPEQLLWRLVKPHLPGHVERVENVAVPGFPDVNGCFKELEYWVELKVSKNKYKKVDVDRLLEDSQRVWIFKRLRVGGRVFVLVRQDKTLFIYQPELLSGGLKFTKFISFVKPFQWQRFTALFTFLLEV